MLAIVLALGFLLTTAGGADVTVVKVYRGNCAEGGKVTEFVRSTNGSTLAVGNDFEVLNITVVFANGSMTYAAPTFDQRNTILLRTFEPVTSNSSIGIDSGSESTGDATTALIYLDPQTGFAMNVTVTDTAGSVLIFTIDGTNFTIPGSTSNAKIDVPFYFDGKSMVGPDGTVIPFSSDELDAFQKIHDSFTNSWSALAAFTYGVLDHGSGAYGNLYVTDGKGGSAILTDAKGVPLNTTIISESAKGCAETSVHAVSIALMLLISVTAYLFL